MNIAMFRLVSVRVSRCAFTPRVVPSTVQSGAQNVLCLVTELSIDEMPTIPVLLACVKSGVRVRASSIGFTVPIWKVLLRRWVLSVLNCLFVGSILVPPISMLTDLVISGILCVSLLTERGPVRLSGSIERRLGRVKVSWPNLAVVLRPWMAVTMWLLCLRNRWISLRLTLWLVLAMRTCPTGAVFRALRNVDCLGLRLRCAVVSCRWPLC